MIYYENNKMLAKCNIGEVILEEVESIIDNDFYWRVVPKEFYNKNQFDYPSICNADMPEELKIWCDLHKMNVIGIYPLDMHKEIYGETVVI